MPSTLPRELSIFGAPGRAEKILSWSKARPEGARSTTSRESGLSLEAVARGESPRVYFYFDSKKLAQKFSSLPGLRARFMEDGLLFDILGERVEIILYAASRKIWSGNIDHQNQELLCMVEVSAEGHKIYYKEECAKLTERSAPLAVFSAGKKEISLETKAFLARDAIYNALLSGE